MIGWVLIGLLLGGPEAVEITVYGNVTCAEAKISQNLGPEDRCVRGNDADVPLGVDPSSVSHVRVIDEGW